jgi:hypothetical protein
MSKRLQVLLDEDELAEIQTIANRKRMTVAEWVRQALRRARQQEPLGNRTQKLAAIRVAAQHSFPTADIDQMLDDIEDGYLSDKSR